jgi:putative DNA primase/helicase
MNQNFFEFKPAFKPHLSGNHKPRLRSVGLAMRRRVNMIPFAVTIPQAERDPQLVEKLKAEWPGVLQWMIDGCLDWQERGGLAPPEAVTKATDDYFASEDGFADWIADRCEEVRGHLARSSELFASWRDYAEKAGLQAGDTKRFREEMEGRGYPHKHNMSGNYYIGLRIRQDQPEGAYDGR